MLLKPTHHWRRKWRGDKGGGGETKKRTWTLIQTVSVAGKRGEGEGYSYIPSVSCQQLPFWWLLWHSQHPLKRKILDHILLPPSYSSLLPPFLSSTLPLPLFPLTSHHLLSDNALPLKRGHKLISPFSLGQLQNMLLLMRWFEVDGDIGGLCCVD